MMKIKKFVEAIVLVLPLLGNAQDPKEELIKWTSSRQLSWNDYKGKVDPSSDAAASTSTYLGIEYRISGNDFSYKISCSFSKNKSWGRFKNEYILSHEQGHFDITEIFARKLNKEMSEYKFSRDAYKKDFAKIYDDVMDEKEKMQEQYDKETDFSRNKTRQAEWLKKIETMLEELNEFANY